MSSSASEMQRTGVPARLPARGELHAAPPITVSRTAVVRRPAPLTATSLLLVAALLLGFVGYVTLLSPVVHARAQSLHYAELREQLASGTAPTGAAAIDVGAPVALVELMGRREVVLEGTTSQVLRDGPGHRRDTVLPGQSGTAVVFGRRAAFGAPFADVADLRRGSEIAVTTGQGRFIYRVTGQRRGGEPAPAPLSAGSGRLTLVTATGLPYLPERVVRVDAELVGAAAPTPARQVTTLATNEPAMAGDRTRIEVLLAASLALLLAACGLSWLWVRWGPRQAWVVSVPVLAALAVAVSAEAVLVLPNLL